MVEIGHALVEGRVTFRRCIRAPSASTVAASSSSSSPTGTVFAGEETPLNLKIVLVVTAAVVGAGRGDRRPTLLLMVGRVVRLALVLLLLLLLTMPVLEG